MKLHHFTLSLIALIASTAAVSQTKAPEPPYTLSYNVGVTSDYRFRGVTQTSTDPALQAGIDFAHKSGIYLGAWGSNISWIKNSVMATDGSLEIDLYGGYKGSISKDLSFDVGMIRYQYPGNTAANVTGFVDANTTEVYAALTYGPATLKYSSSTGNFIANTNSSGSGYLELAATFDLGGGYSLTPHLGHQTVSNAVNADYTDYALTLGKDLGSGWSASIAATGTDADKTFYIIDSKGKWISDSALLVGLKYSF